MAEILSLNKSSSSANPIAGQPLSYLIQVQNTGDTDASSVVIVDTLPSIFLNPLFNFNGGTTLPWTGSFNIGTVPAGTTNYNLRLSGTLDPGATGTIVNTAVLTSPITVLTSTVTIPIRTRADTSVSKSASPNPAVAGGNLQYTLQVQNVGPSNAGDVVLIDTIPSEVSNVQYSIDGGPFLPWTNSHNFGTIVQGESHIVTMVGTVSASAVGDIVNTASLSSSTVDLSPEDNVATVTVPVLTSAAVSVIKGATPSPVIAGTTLTYSITVSNTGPSDAKNVSLADSIPSSLANAQYSTDGGVSFSPWSTPYNIGTLSKNTSKNIIIRGNVTSGAIGNIINTVTVSSSTPNPNPRNTVSTVTTPINASADLSVTKVAPPTSVLAGQTLIYTIVVKNSGPSDAQNVALNDNIPSSLTNVQYSVDGGLTYNNWVSPYAIGTIPNGTSKTIYIKGTVTSSATNPIVNTVTISSTTPDPTPGNTVATVTTPVDLAADLSVVKTTNSTSVSSGDIVTYTVVVSNAGPSNAQNVTLADSIPSNILNPQFSTDGGLTFNNWVNPYTIGTLLANASSTIIINGTAATTPIGTVKNTATVSSSTSDPNPGNNSSSATINVLYADLISPGNFIKSTNKAYAEVGDTITYTLNLTNTGNTTANNVVITDSIPNGTSYIAGSLQADVPVTGTPETTINITNGITPNQTVTLRFSVRIDQLPDPNPIPNKALVSYNYIGNPNNPPRTVNGASNTVTTDVTQSLVQTNKSASPAAVNVGDEITYTVKIQNSGTTKLENVIFKDPLSSYVEFVQGSFTVNGDIYSLVDLNVGVNIGNIEPSQIVNINYKVKVKSAPPNNLIKNIATIDYQYRVDPNSPPIQKSQSTNEVLVPVIDINIRINKSVDKEFADINDILTYTITVQNKSTVAVSNMVVSDQLDPEATYIEGSLKLNGSPVANTNPFNGVYISSLQPNTTAIITFEAKATAIPSDNTVDNVASVKYYFNSGGTQVEGNKVSNPTQTRINNATLNIIKCVDDQTVVKGQVLEYTILITNTGNVSAINSTLIDVLDPRLDFVDNSLSINGVNKPGMNIKQPIFLGTIIPNETVTIKFNALVIDANIYDKIDNQSIVNYQYVVNPLYNPVKKVARSNEVVIVVIEEVPVHTFKNKDRCSTTNKKCMCSNSCNTCVDNSEFSYDVLGICDAQDYININKQIGITKSWTEQDIYTCLETENTFGEIELVNSISGSAKIIRQRVINTPGIIPISNYENKQTSSKKVIVECELEFDVEYVYNNKVYNKIQKQLFSSYIIVDNSYAENISVDACIEDISIVDICGNMINLKSSVMLYVSTEDCNEVCDTNNNYYVNESLGCGNFLTVNDKLWSQFFIESVSPATNICNINSIRGTITTTDKKVVTTPNKSQNSCENLISSNKKLVVCMILKLVISYTDQLSNCKTTIVDVPYSYCIALPNDNIIYKNFDINYCIEDIFAICLDNCLFINTSVIMKAKKVVCCK